MIIETTFHCVECADGGQEGAGREQQIEAAQAPIVRMRVGGGVRGEKTAPQE